MFDGAREWGSKGVGTYVKLAVYRDKSPIYQVSWRETGTTRACSERTRDYDKAVARGEEVFQMLRLREVDIKKLDQQTIRQLRLSDDMLCGTGVTLVEAVRRFVAMRSQSGKEEPEIVFARGLQAGPKPAKNEITIEQAKEPMFRYFRSARGLESSALRAYSVTLKKLAGLLAGRFVSAIDKPMLLQLLSRFEKAPASYAGELGRCRKIMEWLRFNDNFTEDGDLPSHRIPFPNYVRRMGPPKIYSTRATIRQIRFAPESLLAAQVLLAFNLFRPCEVYRMTYEQLFLYFDEGWIWVPASVAKKTPGSYAIRWCRLNPLTKILLEKHRDKKGWLVPGTKKFTHNHYLEKVREFLARIGVETVGDGLRKGCISMHAALGVDLHRTSKWAGNSPATIRKFYDNPATTEAHFRVLAAVFLGCKTRDKLVKDAMKAIRSSPTTPSSTLIAKDLVPYRRDCPPC